MYSTALSLRSKDSICYRRHFCVSGDFRFAEAGCCGRICSRAGYCCSSVYGNSRFIYSLWLKQAALIRWTPVRITGYHDTGRLGAVWRTQQCCGFRRIGRGIRASNELYQDFSGLEDEIEDNVGIHDDFKRLCAVKKSRMEFSGENFRGRYKKELGSSRNHLEEFYQDFSGLRDDVEDNVGIYENLKHLSAEKKDKIEFRLENFGGRRKEEMDSSRKNLRSSDQATSSFASSLNESESSKLGHGRERSKSSRYYRLSDQKAEKTDWRSENSSSSWTRFHESEEKSHSVADASNSEKRKKDEQRTDHRLTGIRESKQDLEKVSTTSILQERNSKETNSQSRKILSSIKEEASSADLHEELQRQRIEIEQLRKDYQELLRTTKKEEIDVTRASSSNVGYTKVEDKEERSSLELILLEEFRRQRFEMEQLNANYRKLMSAIKTEKSTQDSSYFIKGRNETVSQKNENTSTSASYLNQEDVKHNTNTVQEEHKIRSTDLDERSQHIAERTDIQSSRVETDSQSRKNVRKENTSVAVSSVGEQITEVRSDVERSSKTQNRVEILLKDREEVSASERHLINVEREKTIRDTSTSASFLNQEDVKHNTNIVQEEHKIRSTDLNERSQHIAERTDIQSSRVETDSESRKNVQKENTSLAVSSVDEQITEVRSDVERSSTTQNRVEILLKDREEVSSSVQHLIKVEREKKIRDDHQVILELNIREESQGQHIVPDVIITGTGSVSGPRADLEQTTISTSGMEERRQTTLARDSETIKDQRVIVSDSRLSYEKKSVDEDSSPQLILETKGRQKSKIKLEARSSSSENEESYSNSMKKSERQEGRQTTPERGSEYIKDQRAVVSDSQVTYEKKSEDEDYSSHLVLESKGRQRSKLKLEACSSSLENEENYSTSYSIVPVMDKMKQKLFPQDEPSSASSSSSEIMIEDSQPSSLYMEGSQPSSVCVEESQPSYINIEEIQPPSVHMGETQPSSSLMEKVQSSSFRIEESQSSSSCMKETQMPSDTDQTQPSSFIVETSSEGEIEESKLSISKFDKNQPSSSQSQPSASTAPFEVLKEESQPLTLASHSQPFIVGVSTPAVDKTQSSLLPIEKSQVEQLLSEPPTAKISSDSQSQSSPDQSQTSSDRVSSESTTEESQLLHFPKAEIQSSHVLQSQTSSGRAASESPTEESQLPHWPKAEIQSSHVQSQTSSDRVSSEYLSEKGQLKNSQLPTSETSPLTKRSGKSLWSLVADVFRVRWRTPTDSQKSTVMSLTKSSPNESVSSEAWYSGHELEHEEEERRTATLESEPSKATADEQPGQSISGSSSSGTGRENESDKRKLLKKNKPVKREEVEEATADDQLVLTKPDFQSELLVPGPSSSGIDRDNETERRRPLRRIKQVKKEEVEEWEDAYRIETEQRKIDEFFMREALVEAKKAGDMWEVPVGAVLVQDGKIIARGSNL